MLNGKTAEERERAVKYFIIQGLGSRFVFCGGMLFLGEQFFWSN